MMNKKTATRGYHMNGGATAKQKSEKEKISRRDEYAKVKLVRPVGEPSIPEKDLIEAVHSVVKKHEKALA